MTTTDAMPSMRRDGKSEVFFDAAAREELMLKRCDRCAAAAAPEATLCPQCGASDLSWVPGSGEATLVTWTTVHKPPNAAYAGAVPYMVGVVELAEGPWMYASISGRPEAGAVLHLQFVHPVDGESYPVWHTESGV